MEGSSVGHTCILVLFLYSILMISMRKKLLHRILFIFCIVYFSINYCIAFKLLKYSPHHHHHHHHSHQHLHRIHSLKKRYELFEPLDMNLVRAMFIGHNRLPNLETMNTDDIAGDGDDDDDYNDTSKHSDNHNSNSPTEEYYTNSKNHLGSIMRYG
ncbi:hypothetical protein MN116_004372 [Schistosoma mekongi]|uniref:Uncharacterized protein n=1 Tax=Schistosoma mekongi TaxID=38744 RepID=A0AAE1ZFN8_SCHME|nr:hypothetical protein MN116_004372 [Schistosoma mekongi]